ncbi:MAG TPA: TRAP transporter substrate-binding protein DctP [Gaiellaceae bacterium]|nr:TRAP transporter substrate-binding protein DctP [Gaiellaceae bacterium]
MRRIALLALAALAAGCGAQHATKAGKRSPPVVLWMAARDSDLAYDFPAFDFAQRVERLSHGSIRIKTLGGYGNDEPGAEQEIVRAVAAGRVDLTAVGTRVLDTLGVTSFRALTAPLLIDGYGLERKVIASPIPGRMLPGLGRIGITGLAVLGEGMRKPISVRRPLLAPGDWRGVAFAAFRSAGAAATIRALGAHPSGLWGPALSAALEDGRVQGAESDLFQYVNNARESQAPFVAVNVNLWPRTEVLLVNAKRFSRLTGEQRGWLRRAAAAAAARSTAEFDHDAGLAASACGAGARLVRAAPAQLAALRRALQPVYAGLRRDPQTRTMIAEIERLKGAVPRDPALPACAGARVAPTAARPAPDALDGIYRVRWSEQELVEAGAPLGAASGDFGYAHGEPVVVTMTLRGGHVQVAFRPDPGSPCTGTYAVSGQTVAIELKPPLCQGRTIARWSLAHGLLRLDVTRATGPGDVQLYGAKPWLKIG